MCRSRPPRPRCPARVSDPARGAGCVTRTYVLAQENGVSDPARGAGCVSGGCRPPRGGRGFRPREGRGLCPMPRWEALYPSRFPTPRGARVVSWISVRPVGTLLISDPARGAGCVRMAALSILSGCAFPTPRGARVVSSTCAVILCALSFPTPRGARVVSSGAPPPPMRCPYFRPREGRGLCHYCYFVPGLEFVISDPARGAGCVGCGRAAGV